MSEKNPRPILSAKTYYVILTACLILIIGASAVVYNIAANKSRVQSEPESTVSVPSYSVKITTSAVSEQANVPATGVPKESTTTTTADKSLLPYTGSFGAPTSGKIIKDYSAGEMVKSKTTDDWRVHNGIDFSAENGESVLAVQSGEITKVDKDELWGVKVELSCPGDLKVIYSGIADGSEPKKGDKVKKGDVLGNAGLLPIESADGVHIHLETKVEDKTVSPVDALNLM